MRYLDGAPPSRDLRAGIVDSVEGGIHLALNVPADLGAQLLDDAATDLGDTCKIVRVHAGPAGLSMSGMLRIRFGGG